ncbi:MAG TPA: zinc ribbon domain-containing protein [Phycisphaerae bacterium]|jgi:hypothetical protein
MTAPERSALAARLLHAIRRLGMDYVQRRRSGLSGVGEYEPLARECRWLDCGHANPYQARFCASCGRRLDTPVTVARELTVPDLPRQPLWYREILRAFVIVLLVILALYRFVY